jgi:GH15 family glucan-1,4-alpha-glucosidase
MRNTVVEHQRNAKPKDMVPKGARYLPIERHAAIGDRRTAAMVGADGRIDWWCLPNFDGDMVFGALIDAERGGCWRLGPANGELGVQEYIDDTAVVTTSWSSAAGELELVDGMLWPERANDHPDAHRRVLMRRLRCKQGSISCAMELTPRDMFGAPIPVKTGTDSQMEGDGARWLGFWASDPELAEQISVNSRVSFTLKEGETIWMVLGDREPPGLWHERAAEKALKDTLAAWSRWSGKHPILGPRKDAVRRSVTTIRLLSFQPNGNQVAAPTCSLPEKVGDSRNYDYRYAWIRDSSLALAILAMFGDLDAAEHYMDWLSQLGSSTEMPLQVLYKLNGECDIKEQELKELDGYCGSKPVRLGNGAEKQFQLDSLGYFVDCALIYLQQGGRWKPQYWELIHRIADFTAANWQRKDNGIWELSELRHYVSSKVMSWVVLDRACRIAAKLKGVEAPPHWKKCMDQIHADVMQHGWSESMQSFRQHYESDDLDASVLLLVTMEFLPADHPRSIATVKAIREHLERDSFVWRFHPRSLGNDDMPLDGMESAFLPCTFWLASALARQGKREEAEKILDRVDAAFGDLGIYPEEADPTTGAALGNMPMIFSHAEHLKAVMDYAKASPLTFMEMAAGKMARKITNTFG